MGQLSLVFPVAAQVETSGFVQHQGSAPPSSPLRLATGLRRRPARGPRLHGFALAQDGQPGFQGGPLPGHPRVLLEFESLLEQTRKIEADVARRDLAARQGSGQHDFGATLPAESDHRAGEMIIEGGDRTAATQCGQVGDQLADSLLSGASAPASPPAMQADSASMSSRGGRS